MFSGNLEVHPSRLASFFSARFRGFKGDQVPFLVERELCEDRSRRIWLRFQSCDINAKSRGKVPEVY